MTHDDDDHRLDGDADARIDAIARSAGGELRRPAPADGITRVQRARRTKQMTRLAVGGTAVIALATIGAVTLNGRDRSGRVVPAETVADTVPTSESVEPTTTVAPGPVVTGPAPTTPTAPTTTIAPPATLAPSTTIDDPSAAGTPAVYATSDPDVIFGAGDLTLVDPTTGASLGVQPVDADAARAAQDALLDSRPPADLGDVAYEFEQVAYDAGTLNTDAFPDVDLCGQNPVTLTAPAGSEVPARAKVLEVSPDGTYVVVISAVCPQPGTMGADSVGTLLPYTSTLQVFDARHPEVAGRTLATFESDSYVGNVSFGEGGRFAAVEASDLGYRLFDLDSGDEIDLGLEGCTASGTNYSRFIGPWVGGSSIALSTYCNGRSALFVHDLATGVEVTRSLPNNGTREVSAEVDRAHFVSPLDAWYILCDHTEPSCSVGHGDGEVVTLPGTIDASFLPLGFTYGG